MATSGSRELNEQHASVVSRGCATVVVLGDVGHSPRTQYQAISLASAGYRVRMVGYKGVQIIHRIHIVSQSMNRSKLFIYI